MPTRLGTRLQFMRLQEREGQHFLNVLAFVRREEFLARR
jgi:hypothetical protein